MTTQPSPTAAHPLDLLGALGGFMDIVRDYIVANNETVSDELRSAYWSVWQQVDAWHDEIQPHCIYPEPAPIENCRHPYDRDFAFLYEDVLEEGWYIVRCCCVCGNIDPPGRISPKKRNGKKKEPTT